MKLLIFVFFLLLSACASEQKVNNYISESDYHEVISRGTQHSQVYDGLTNILEIHATLQNSLVLKSQLLQNGKAYQWDEATMAQEKSKMDSSSSKETNIFVSFFTPEKKHDDLHKPKTMWKIFLDVAGRRYEGKATKIKLPVAELQNLYPDHNRWSTPYSVSFPVSVQNVDSNPARLTFTGPVGSTTLDFQPAQTGQSL